MKTRFVIFLLLFLAVSQVHALSTAVKVDLLTHKITAALNAEDYTQAAELFKEFDALDVAMPPALLLQRARVYFHEKDYVQAQNALEKYLGEAERGSAEYNQALAMYTDVEVGLELQQFWKEQEALLHAVFLADMQNDTDNWTEMREKLYFFPCPENDYAGVLCYKDIDNSRGCYILEDFDFYGHSIDIKEYEWQGKCDRGFAHGHGTLRMKSINGNVTEKTGSFGARGIPQGHWKKVHSSGYWLEYSYDVNGQLHGLYKSVFEDELWSEYHYVNGKLHGLAKGVNDDSGRWEVPYVNGKRHGTLTEHHHNGATSYSCYRNGERVDYDDPC